MIDFGETNWKIWERNVRSASEWEMGFQFCEGMRFEWPLKGRAVLKKDQAG
jgi:hypothetical protein